MIGGAADATARGCTIQDAATGRPPVTYAEGPFDGPGGRLYERRWEAAAARASVAVVHGYAEHSGRYHHVGRALAGVGYAVAALDLRGHGRSDGRRTAVRSFDEYLADVDALLARVRERRPGLPLFLLGHSMGGTVVALRAMRGGPGIDGVILSGAGLAGRAGTPAAVVSLFLLLGRLLPRLPLTRLDAAAVSRDPEVVRRYLEDPLVYRGRMRAGTFAAIVRAVRAIDAGMEAITLPLLLLHGTADALTAPEGSRALHARAASADRTLKLYEGLFHEVLNEPERDRVLADVIGWLQARA